MATALSVVTASAIGQTPLTTTAADTTGNTFQNDGVTWLYVDSGTAGGTLTVKSNVAFPTGITLPDKVYTLTANTIYLFGPGDFPYSVTGDTIKVTASVNTIKLAAFH
jgi:hypothetical protein